MDPDQTPHYAASDLGLHCLLKHVCPNTLDKYIMLSVCLGKFISSGAGVINIGSSNQHMVPVSTTS